jgi:hypothetical protein
MYARRGTILFHQNPDSHRVNPHYLGSKNREQELINELTLRINSSNGDNNPIPKRSGK